MLVRMSTVWVCYQPAFVGLPLVVSERRLPRLMSWVGCGHGGEDEEDDGGHDRGAGPGFFLISAASLQLPMLLLLRLLPLPPHKNS